MTTKRPFGLPSAKLIVIAAVAGILAGAVAVYVRNVGSGNGADGGVAGLFSSSSGACEGAVETAKSVSQFSKGQVAAMVAAQPPRPISLVFKGADGKELKTADFAGKTVLLNLWATWCVPCREEMPALNALQKEVGGKDFEVVAVNIDTGSDDKPRNFLTDYKIDDLGFYRDSSMGVFNVLKKEGLAFGLPATLILDRKGCLISSMNGPAAWDSPDAKALVKAAIGL
ncbi:thiol:disulfide interchange protein TlpA [Neorhizobium alkalisoli]|uniref:Thiol-disulfide isomerase/thioredoxin n=1 Tax=Neorhizobium alkalisoli TaxID=528178 RepID=A0A561QJ04_9HYPH|nr:TlpA disulfide reductase family protein [Neorhizobium alkalisoli]TWF50350.1 thiol-disulfide isomerase/thioredoxin [Neorhizobium alkalisoli]